MKLIYENNLPDNVSERDPNFWHEDPVFDPSKVSYAKITYTALDPDPEYGEFEETVDVYNSDREIGFDGSTFVDDVLENAYQMVQEYLDDEGANVDLLKVEDIVFVDEDGNKFYSDDIKY